MSLRRRNDPTHTRAQKDVESETESKIQQKPGHGSDNSRVIYLLAASFILITIGTAALYSYPSSFVGRISTPDPSLITHPTPVEEPLANVSASPPSEQSYSATNSSIWGPYRTGTFFGLRDLSPYSPLIGLMWHDNERRDWHDHIRHDVISDDASMRQMPHVATQLNLDADTLTSPWMSTNDGVSRVEHTRAHPDGYYLQSIIDRDLNITTEFVRLPHGQFRAVVSVCAVGHCGDKPSAGKNLTTNASTVHPDRLVTLLPYIQPQHPQHRVNAAPQFRTQPATGKPVQAFAEQLVHPDVTRPFVMHIARRHSDVAANSTSSITSSGSIEGSLLLTRPLPWSTSTPVKRAKSLLVPSPSTLSTQWSQLSSPATLAPIQALIAENIAQAKQCIDREPLPQQLTLELAERMDILSQREAAAAANKTSPAATAALASAGIVPPLKDGLETLCGSDDGVRVAVNADRNSLIPFDLPLRPNETIWSGSLTRLPVALDAYYYDDDYKSYLLDDKIDDHDGNAHTPVSWNARPVEHFPHAMSPDLRSRVQEQYRFAQMQRRPVFPLLMQRGQEIRRHRSTTGKTSLAAKNPAYMYGTGSPADFPFLYTGLDGQDHCARTTASQATTGRPLGAAAAHTQGHLCATVWEATLALPLRYEMLLVDAGAAVAASESEQDRAALLTAVGAASSSTIALNGTADPPASTETRAIDAGTAPEVSTAAAALYAALERNAHVQSLAGLAARERRRLVDAEDDVLQRLWAQRGATSAMTRGMSGDAAASSRSDQPPAFLQSMLASLVAGAGYHEGASHMTVTVAPSSAKLPSSPLTLTSNIAVHAPAYLTIPPLHQSLLTLSPSRQCFPRGFLWDEGMHHFLLATTYPALSRAALRSWAALTHASGWLPREQILGWDARRRVPGEFQRQRDDIANPPTQMLAVAAMAAREIEAVWAKQLRDGVLLKGNTRDGVDGSGKMRLDQDLIPALGIRAVQKFTEIDFTKVSPADPEYASFSEFLSFLDDVLPAYRAQSAWFVRSQASSYNHTLAPTALPLDALNDMQDTYTYNTTTGLFFEDSLSVPATAACNTNNNNPPATAAAAAPAVLPSALAWRQRSKYHALASGLDDYPRLAVGPSPFVLLEGHVDAAAWAVAAMDAMYALHSVLLYGRGGGAVDSAAEGTPLAKWASVLRKHMQLSLHTATALHRAMFRAQYDLQTHSFGDFAVISQHYNKELQLRFDAGWYDMQTDVTVRGIQSTPATQHNVTASQASAVPSTLSTAVQSAPRARVAAPSIANEEPHYVSADVLHRSRAKIADVYASLATQTLATTSSQRPFYERSRALNDLRMRSSRDVEQHVQPGHTWVHHLGYVAFTPLFTHTLRIQGRLESCRRPENIVDSGKTSCFSVPLLLASDASPNRGFQHPAYTAVRNSNPLTATAAASAPSTNTATSEHHLGPAPLFPSAFTPSQPQSTGTAAPLPLLSPLSALSRALSLLSSPALLTPHGPRSLARGDPYYGTGEDYWRGSVWAPVAYLMWRAVVQYSREVAVMRDEVGVALVAERGEAERVRVDAMVNARWEWSGAGIPDAKVVLKSGNILSGKPLSEVDFAGELSLPDAYFALSYLDKQTSALATALRTSFPGAVSAAYEKHGFVYEQYRAEDGAGARCKPFTGWSALAALMAVGDDTV